MEEKTDLRIRKPYKALCDAFVTILEKKRFESATGISFSSAVDN